MDLTSGYPFWPISAGLLGVHPALAGDIECDVAVVGGGLAGALVAYRLVEAGIDTVLVDKRDIGWGNTSASTALLQYELDISLVDLIAKIGERDAVEAYRLCLEAISGIEQLVSDLGDDCGFAWRPSLTLGSRRPDIEILRREYECRTRFGFELEYWDRKKLGRHFPCERPAALFTPEAAEINPYRLTHALVRKATDRGLRTFDRTEIVRRKEIRARGGEQLRLTTAQGHWITAGTVVDATGYEAARALGRRSRVRLRNTYALISEPIPEDLLWYGRALIWETSRPYLYLRTTQDHRVIIGGLDDRFAKPIRRDRSVRSKAAKLERRFIELFPDIRIENAFAWGGTFAETADGLPYIGRDPGSPAVLFALCYGGNGTLFTLIAADIIRDILLGRSSRPERLFRIDR
jgi:glycine/D-amino acid oxidase-like deaminating enzyme